jgi:hypothetical protein
VYNLKKLREDGVLDHHSRAITAIAGNEGYVVAGSREGAISVTRSRDHEVLDVMQQMPFEVSCLGMHPSLPILLSAHIQSSGSALCAWNISSLKLLATSQLPSSCWSLGWHQSSNYYMAVCETVALIYKITGNEAVVTLASPGPEKLLCGLWMGDELLVGDNKGSIWTYHFDLADSDSKHDDKVKGKGKGKGKGKDNEKNADGLELAVTLGSRVRTLLQWREHVIALTSDGTIYCLSREDGALLSNGASRWKTVSSTSRELRWTSAVLVPEADSSEGSKRSKKKEQRKRGSDTDITDVNLEHEHEHEHGRSGKGGRKKVKTVQSSGRKARAH